MNIREKTITIKFLGIVFFSMTGIDRAYAIPEEYYNTISSTEAYQKKMGIVAQVANKVKARKDKKEKREGTQRIKLDPNKFIELARIERQRQQAELGTQPTDGVNVQENDGASVIKTPNNQKDLEENAGPLLILAPNEKANGNDKAAPVTSGEDTEWQTIAPLGPNIRKKEAGPETPKITPEEGKYQKEKEEFLKKVKK
ncbi:MAG: hypothetical protein HYV97_06795 [Bdellovibrio sp.]|nr:hypothetical protein [Bdellovibrio sp.]